MIRMLDMLRSGIKLRLGEDYKALSPAEIGDPVPVIADAVGKLYWQSTQNMWSFTEDFGPLRPPFPTMWIEYQLPPRCYVDGWHNRLVDQVGARIQQTKDDAFILETIAGVGTQLGWLCGYQFNLNDDGTYLSHVQMVPDDIKHYFDGGHDGFAPMMHPVALALSFMHCKNVQLLEPKEGQIRRPGKREAKTRFVTIRIPGQVTSATTRTAARAAMGEPQPLHLVRGHFKTFTSDAPLFGKVTGTYWWGWQTRGNPERGTVEHAYEVAP